MPPSEQAMSLAPVLLVFAALIFAAVGWCLLSSCVGTPIIRFFSGLWESIVLSSQVGSGPSARRRRGLGEEEMWEMEHRGRI